MVANNKEVVTSMKVPLIVSMCSITLWSCVTKRADESKVIDTVVSAKVGVDTPASKTEIDTNKVTQQQRWFSPVSSFPKIADSIRFISELLTTYNLEVDVPDPLKDGKITAYKKIKLNGSDKQVILIEYNWYHGCTATYPWKYQLLFFTDGKPIKCLSALRYELVRIFPHQHPYLFTCVSTGKGNGGHEIYKLTADTLENVYEGYYDYAVQTYNAHQDGNVYQPHELKLSISDINNDGLNDIIFKGKVIHEEKSKRPQPVAFVFLFDKQSGHFKAKENYNEEYKVDTE